jgi:hypothetical protein
MIKRLSVVFFIILSSYNVYASWWNMQWIRYPDVDSTAQIWFRKQYNLPDITTRASVSIASSGRYILYLNGRNVSVDVLVPHAQENSNTTSIITFEISRFLHKGNNTIAIWYSPTLHGNKSGRQIAVDFYGETAAGESFSYNTDSTWLCKKSNACTTANNNEIIIAPEYLYEWKDKDCPIYDWKESKICDSSKVRYKLESPISVSNHINHIYPYRSFDNDGNKVLYDFGHSFIGWTRVTLRGMRKGQRIEINGLTYICSGEMDEQACRKFTDSESGRALVIGPADFSIDKIMKIEGIEITPYFNITYQY